MNTIVDFSLAGGVAKILPIKIDGITAGRNSMVKTTIGYNDPSSTTATGQVRTWKSGATTYTYAYDARGNITSVSDGQSTTTYAYDSFDQLVRENNQAAGKTWTYAYDDGGNIQSKTEYAYTTGSLGAAERTVTYGYGDAGWSDLLTSIDGQSLTTDALGNLLSDGTWAYTWQHGRQLAGMNKSGQTITYGYDSDGKRITKTVDGTTYNYHYLGDQLVELTWDGNKLHFTYDSTGPLSVNCNGTEYFYVKNAQGDVTGLVSASGTRVVTYTYDAWGNPLTTTGSLATTLGAANPLRYRGYVYDTETGLYYLQSRYYNPTWGRFINADDTAALSASPGRTHWDKNLYAYCDNNPTSRVDDEGDLWDTLLCGAVMGIATQYVFDVVDNLADGAQGWSVFKPRSNGYEYFAAAVDGALAVSKLSAAAAKAVNGLVGGFTYIASAAAKGETIDGVELVQTVAIKVFSTGKGKNWERSKGIISTSKKVVSQTSSPRKKAVYSSKIATEQKKVKEDVKGYVRSGFGWKVVDKICNFVKGLFRR